MSTHLPYRPAHADPAVTAHHSNTAAFLSQIDTRHRSYQQPDIEPCYCAHDIQAHVLPYDACEDCPCEGYVEHTEVIATRNTLDADDELNEGRRRDNTPAALRIERRARRRTA